MSQDVKVTVENGVKVLEIRNGKANDIHVSNSLKVEGLTIDAVREYLSKEGIDADEIKNSFVLYSIEALKIELVYALRGENPDSIHGKLTLHPDLKKFEINEGKRYTTHQLADFVRMNRHYFETKDVALKLEGILRNFIAEVDKKFEAADDKRANVKASIVQTVRTNIPEDFTLMLPVFVGTDATPIKVEIDINSSDISCSLVSPALKELIDTEAKAIIGNELQQIRDLYPQLRIFQK